MSREDESKCETVKEVWDLMEEYKEREMSNLIRSIKEGDENE